MAKGSMRDRLEQTYGNRNGGSQKPSSPPKKEEKPYDRKEIEVNTHEAAVNDEIMQVLREDKSLYQRSGVLVEVINREETGIEIKDISQANLRERLTRLIRFVRETKEGQTSPVHPPEWSVAAIAQRGIWPGVPELTAVAEFPVLTPAGHLLIKDGYDPASKMYLSTGCGDIDLPKKITPKRLGDSVGRLRGLVSQFPWRSPRDEAAWFAALLTPICRPVIFGPCPMFLVDANLPGSGKTLLAQLIAVILTGRKVGVQAWPEQLDQRQTIISAIAITGRSVLLLDNLTGRFGDAVTDAVLTSESWQYRPFRTQRTVEIPLRCVMIGTGNNLTLAGDTPRRVLRIRLECAIENPEERQGFDIPDLLTHVREHRKEVLTDLLTMVQWWMESGRPADLPAWGSYEAWTSVVRGIIDHCGLGDPYDQAAKATLADFDDGATATFLRCLFDLDPDKEGISVADILRRVDAPEREDDPINMRDLRSALQMICPKGTTSQLGARLRAIKRRPIDGLFIDTLPPQRGLVRWVVREKQELIS